MFYLSVLYFGTNNGLVHSKVCFPSPHIHSSTFILLQRKKNLFTWLPNQRNSFHFSVYTTFWHRSYSMRKNCKIIVVRDWFWDTTKGIFNKMIIQHRVNTNELRICWIIMFMHKFFNFSFFTSKTASYFPIKFPPFEYNIHVL